jgi:hypothetical protein
MNLFLRKLLRSYRDDAGCPPPAEPDWESPCRTCRATDAVLAEEWRPLEWSLDSPLVAELEDGRFATIEAEGKAWKWKLEAQEGWTLRVVGEGTDPSLADALYAVERLARGL